MENVYRIIIDVLKFFFQTTNDVDRLIEEQLQKLKQLKRPIRPFIVVVGTNKEISSDIYLVLEKKVMYECKSVIHAFDISFKTTKVLNLSYPPASEYLWQILAEGLYSIQGTAVHSVASEVLSDLDCLRQKAL